MALLKDIVQQTNELLDVEKYKDYCPNGLQVEGRKDVQTIISGVTASQALLDAAIEHSADLILVHHGFFWKGEKEVITGLKKNRIATLIRNDVSLLAYHLPLDGHISLGNNAQLALKLGLQVVDRFGPGKLPLGLITEPGSPITKGELVQLFLAQLSRQPLILSGSGQDKAYQRIAICTGAAQSFFESAIDAGVDAFVTGEVSEQSYHLAMESGVDFISAGHHATERFGVMALGEYLSKEFHVTHKNLEINNPV